MVEYTKWDVAEDDFKMLDAAQQCMIYLIQRQEPRENGDIRFVSSVWALSNDRTVRLQQKRTLTPTEWLVSAIEVRD